MEHPALDPTDNLRQRALQTLQEGLSTAECARRLGVSRQTVERWRAQSTDGTARPPARRGRKPLLSPGQRQAVLQLLTQPAELHGFGAGGWTRTRIQILLQRRFGVHLSLASITGLRAELDRFTAPIPPAPPPAGPSDGGMPPMPSDIGLFLDWAQRSRDGVIWYAPTLQPLYANPAQLACLNSSFDALRGQSLLESPAWLHRLPAAYVAAVRRAADSFVSSTLTLHGAEDTCVGPIELSVLVQRDPAAGLRGIATVLRRMAPVGAPEVALSS